METNLNLKMYNIAESKKMLQGLYGWEDYGGKHEESVWTHWYQNFYLFHKFGIDKRLAHYSSLINSGQMTRVEAYEKLKESPVYPALGIESKVMSYPKRRHQDFKTDLLLWNFISKVVRFLRKYGIIRRISNNVV